MKFNFSVEEIQLLMKKVENTGKIAAEKLAAVSDTNVATKGYLMQKQLGKHVLKTKMLILAGEMFIQYEKEIDQSAEITKYYEELNEDDKIKNDIGNAIFPSNMKENLISEKIKYTKLIL